VGGFQPQNVSAQRSASDADGIAMVKLKVLLVCACALALGLTSCGGDDGGSSSASPQEDQAEADRAIDRLEQHLRDKGFTVSEDDDDEDEDDDTPETEECKELEAAFPGLSGGDEEEDFPGQTANADSDDFEHGELGIGSGVLEMVSASVAFVENEDDIAQVFEAVRDERFGQCMKDAFTEGLESGAAEDDAEVEMSDLAVDQLTRTDQGDDSAGVRITGEFGTQGFFWRFKMDVEMVRDGRTAAMVLAMALGDGEPTVNRRELLTVLLEEPDRAT
jgi:hypothetical protein